MDILKAATDWAKDELVSTPFFILAGTLFLVISFGLWQVDKTDLARAYIIPMLVAGSLLTIIGLGLFFTNRARIDQFKIDHSENPIAFIEAELARTNATLLEYKNVVFTGIPIIIGICVGILFFVSAPLWRAMMITSISMLSVILCIDGLAHSRISEYHQQLLQEQKEIQNNSDVEKSL
jgi:predicted membrane channel-forming protein YqfA (hemolysin III family)